MRDGFWRVVHPKACCNQLGWDSLDLLSLVPRDLADEARLQGRIPLECGEFWPLERLPELRRALTELAVEKGCAEAGQLSRLCVWRRIHSLKCWPHP